MTSISDTYEDFTWRLINTIPGYSRVDLVADTYQTNSINSQERLHRGESLKVIIQSVECLETFMSI